MEEYSVLMSVYCKEKAQCFKESILSILNQTISTNDFVIVCDGKLTDELDKVIDDYCLTNPNIFNIIRLPQNVGQGRALNYGLIECKNSIIARMDSDDFSFPNRCEMQMKYMKKGFDIISATVKEFNESTDKITAIRTLPETHKEILKFSALRNPFNHPCVMFRKEAVLSAGGYQDFYLYEDYYLWIRMLNNGAIGYNIKLPLLYMRAGKDMYKRRGGYKYFISSRRFQKYLLANHVIGIRSYICNILLRFIVQVILPGNIRGFFFKFFLRSKSC